MRRAALLLLTCGGCYDVSSLSSGFDAAMSLADLASSDDLAGRGDLGNLDLGSRDAGAAVWRTVASPVATQLRALCTDGAALYAVGASSTILKIAADNTVTKESLPPGYSLRGTAASGGSAWAVGDDGTLLQRGNGGWSLSSTLGSGTLYAAFALNATDFFVVGLGGGYFHNQNPEDTGAIEGLFSVWARSATDVFVVGQSGALLHSGSPWTSPDAGTGGDSFGVFGTSVEVLAVGAGGSILRTTSGASWTSETSGTSADLYGVWLGGGEAFAVGAGGVILHKTTAWSSERSSGPSLRAVLGRSPSDVWAIGDEGTILHYSP